MVDPPTQWVVAEAIHSALQAPLYHLIFEAVLVICIFRLLFFKSYRIRDTVPLTEAEKDELIKDWQPEPLVPPLEETLKKSTPYRMVSGPPGKEIVVNGLKCKNFATMNFLGFVENKHIKESAEKCIRKYGVGSCGPRGFYGTVDVHLDLEKRLAEFIGAEESIIYSYGFATVASAIPAYSKRGDILFVDEAVCFAIQKGIQASRSRIIYFKHNNLKDLEEKMKQQEVIDKKDPKKASVTRKFMVVEGIFMNTGQICDLPRLIELKYKYKVRLFIDESLSFGTLGQHGKGVTEHFNVPVSKVDMICGSMEYALASVGGFCCGTHYVINNQRLTGLGYVFSASQPPLLARAAIEAVNMMENEPEMFIDLRSKAALLQELLKQIPGVEITGYPESPSFHLRSENSTNQQQDLEFLNCIVKQCEENGVCVTVASRLDQDLNKPWPPSIRIAVNNNMSESELREGAEVIKNAVAEAREILY